VTVRVLTAGLAILTTALLACSGSDSSVAGNPQTPADGGTGSGADGGHPAGDDASSGGPMEASTGGGDGETPPGDDAAFGDDGSTPLGPYPSGPYGVQVGDVIQDFTWSGYRDDAADAVATSKTYGTYTLDDARKSGKRYAMINLAEVQCPGCQKSAGEIASGGPGVVQAGGVVIEVLETSGFVKQPTKAELDAWITKYMLPVTTVKDPDGAGTPSLDILGPREHAYIVDLTTMKIVQIVPGDYTGIGATSGGKALAAMHQLLGK
jgi:hypothetical protein